MLEEGEVLSADDRTKKSLGQTTITSSDHCQLSRNKTKLKRLKRKEKRNALQKTPFAISRPVSKKTKFNIDDLDEYEMLCVRGASPPKEPSELNESYLPYANYFESPHFYEDIESHKYSTMTKYERREMRRQNDLRYQQKLQPQSMDNPMIGGGEREMCIGHLFGKCRMYPCDKLHGLRHPRKQNLCHFFDKGLCNKGSACPFLHAEFPCTYYYLGVKNHDQSKCNLMHGKPLTNKWKQILLEHMDGTTKFGSIDRQKLIKQMEQQHQKLIELYGEPLEECTNGKQTNNLPANDFKSIQNLAGILTEKQIENLRLYGIVNIDQISQLTVIDLNKIGLTFNQIHEIQMNALNIEKLEKGCASGAANKNETIAANNDKESDRNSVKLLHRNGVRQDVDMRISTIPMEQFSSSLSLPSTSYICDQTYSDSTQKSLVNDSTEYPTSGDETEPRLIINEDALSDDEDPKSPPFLGF